MADLPSAEQIFASLHDAIFLIDRAGFIGRTNPSCEMLLRIANKHLIGNNITNVLRFDDERLSRALADQEANIAARHISLSSNGRKIGVVDVDIFPLSGSDDWRAVSLSFLRKEGVIASNPSNHPASFAVRAPDILSHEIKNPLAAIKGAAQLLSRQLDDRQKPLTDMIASEVERVVKLLNRMQTLASDQPANIEPVNIHRLIDRAQQAIKVASDDRIKFEFAYDPSLPHVLIDPDAMMQILINLLTNAVDAVSDVEQPEIKIITRFSIGAAFATHDDNVAVKLPVEITICDNGPGVPPALESEIFAPFVSTKRDGQGLGLALVKKMLRDMNGQIRYERIANQHSRFTFFLPLAAQNKSGE